MCERATINLDSRNATLDSTHVHATHARTTSTTYREAVLITQARRIEQPPTDKTRAQSNVQTHKQPTRSQHTPVQQQLPNITCFPTARCLTSTFRLASLKNGFCLCSPLFALVHRQYGELAPLICCKRCYKCSFVRICVQLQTRYQMRDCWCRSRTISESTQRPTNETSMNVHTGTHHSITLACRIDISA